MTFNEHKGERREGLKWFAWAFAVLIIFGFIAGAVSFCTKVVSTPARVISKTLDTDNVISNYEWFKRQYQDVQAQDQKIAAANQALKSFLETAGPRNTWGFEDKQEQARLNSVVLGLQNQRASMVAEYNARTQMMNRDLFRTSDLPATLQ